MKETMKKVLVRVVFAFVMLAAVSPMMKDQMTIKVEAKVKPKQKKAIKAYRKFLSKKKITWHCKSGKTKKVSAKSYNFTIAFVERGKAPLLVINGMDRSSNDHSDGYVNVYTYKKGKMKLIITDDNFSFFKNKGVIGLPIPRSEDMGYYRIKNAKLTYVGNRPASVRGAKELWSTGHPITKKNIKKYITKKYLR